MKKLFSVILLGILFALPVSAADISLPSPNKTGGKPLMQALTERKTTRSYFFKTFDDEKAITLEQLSNLLYSASGLNRETKYTIPAAHNRLDLSVYVVLESGTYLFDPKENKLIFKVEGDNRDTVGEDTASAIFIYVSDYSKIKGDIDSKKITSSLHAGSAYQNVYLTAASENLGTGVRTSFDREEITDLLNLQEGNVITVIQPVGVFKE